MLAALFLITVLIGGYLYLTRPARLAGLAGDLLEAMIGAHVDIGEASFGFDGHIHLRDVQLAVPKMHGSENRLFTADQMLIRHDLWSLIKGRFVARSLTLSRPVLYVTEEMPAHDGPGMFNYDYLRLASDPSRTLPQHLPEIFIRQGRIIRGEYQNGEYQLLITMEVNGKFNEKIDQPNHYSFALSQGGSAGDTGGQLNGSLDLETLNVRVEGERFGFETDQAQALPLRLRRWWEMMEPKGEISAFNVSYDSENQIFRAMIEVRGISLTLPYFGEADDRGDGLDESARQFRLTDVAGSFLIVNDRITISELQGNLEGIQYTIEGTIDGLGLKAPFELALLTNEFDVPDRPPYLPSLPEGARQIFEKFKPSGRFQVAARIQRDQIDGPLSYDGSVSLRDGRVTYARFPYPLKNVSGRIVFDDLTIDVVELRGEGPNGGRAKIHGEISPPGEGAAVHMLIDVEDVGVDQLLFDAVPVRFEPLIRMFVDQQQYDRLEKLKLIGPASSGEREFALGGRTDFTVLVTRQYGKNEKVRVDIDMEMGGLGLLFMHWPFPIKLESGRLKIGPDEVVVEDVAGRGLAGGWITMSGKVKTPRNQQTGNRAVLPKLDIVAKAVKMDDLMLAAVPQPQDQWLRRLAMTGLLEAHAHVFADDEGQIVFRADMRLSGGSASPFDGSVLITDLSGDLALEPGSIRIHSMVGSAGSTGLKFSGWAHRSGDDWSFDIDFGASGLRFEDPLLGLLPPDRPARGRIGELIERYKLEGSLDAQLAFASDSTGKETFRLEVQPHDLALDVRGHRLHIKESTGRIIVEPGRVGLDHWGGSFGSGSFKASGQIVLDPMTVELTFDVQADQIDEVTRVALPDGVLTTLDGLKINGGYAVRDGQLFYRPGDPTAGQFGERVLDFSAVVELRGASGHVGVPITELNGQVFVEAIKAPGDSLPRIGLQVHADSLKAASRLISPLRLRVDSIQRLQTLELSDLDGSIYGGTLLGEGRIHLKDSNRFSFSITILDAPLDPMLNPEKYVAGDPDQLPLEQLLETGRLSANLVIEATPGYSRTRRGHGELQIRGAEMYRMPLALSVLHMLNLSAPKTESFDEVTAIYLIDGDNIIFDRVSISAPDLEIAGDGTMQYSDQSLDLVMYSNKPKNSEAGGFGKMFNEMKKNFDCIHVTGTLDDPKPRWVMFRGVGESLQRIFSGNKKKRSDPVGSSVPESASQAVTGREE